ncbi:MAG TPA: FtsX-like permease family protein, partial [Gemmatimonadaceae bacterium]
GQVRPLKESVLGPTIPKVLWAIFGSVILVLLIAVANVANLFIVRMDSRRREATVRAALGADRGHLATHYLSESLLLCLAAATLGVVLSMVGLKALLAIAPQNIPRLQAVSVSWSSIGFALALSLVIGVVFGLMPLLRTLDLSALREGGRGLSMSRAQRTFRSGLVTAQMALALILLASAGLMIRSFMHLRAVKPGLDPANTLVFDAVLPFNEYPNRTTTIAFSREFLRRVSAIPGVVGASIVSDIPLNGGYGTGCTVVWRENMPYAPGAQPPCVSTPVAFPGMLEAFKIAVRGRAPTWSDVDARTQAVVITKALGDRLWPGEDPIGKGIGSNGPNGDGRIADASARWYRVVGVIPELHAEALDRPASEIVFYAPTSPYPEKPDTKDGSLGGPSFVVRTNGVDPASLVPTIQRVMAELNPRIPIQDARTMTEVVAHSMQRTSFVMILLGISATVALILSAVGIYGVISYIVTQRRFEIGVRIALGARVGEVAELVMMQSVRLAIAGIALGVIGTIAVTRLLKALLYNVSPTDPTVLGLVALTLLVIAGLASFAPARRAARIDPVEALRTD